MKSSSPISAQLQAVKRAGDGGNLAKRDKDEWTSEASLQRFFNLLVTTEVPPLAGTQVCRVSDYR